MKRMLALLVMILALVICITGCGAKQESVTNEPLMYEIENEGTITSYTGELKGGKPVGIGQYIITTGGKEWVYKGALENEALSGEGSVDKMPTTLTIDEIIYEGEYTGKIYNGLPNGDGIFTETTNGFTCSGTFYNGQLKIGEEYSVEGFPLTIEFQNYQFDGTYSGSMLNDEPNNEGTFESDDGTSYLRYSGTWQAGITFDVGYLETNQYTVHFTDVERVGTYTGDVNGEEACGNGVFTTTNLEGIDYTYTGEWANGLYNGIGEIVYDDDAWYNRIGHFTDGEFTPDFQDLLQTLGTAEPLFSMTDEELSIAEEFSIGVPEAESYSELVDYYMDISDSYISYNEYIKNPDKYENSNELINLKNYTVVQVWEDSNLLGFDGVISQMIICDENYEHVCHVLIRGDSAGLYENTEINILAYPIDYTQYQSVDNTTILCIYMLAIGIEILD